MDAQFINTNYIYKYTVIEDNVDADLIVKFIWQGQNLNIQEALGSNLYEKLLTDCPNFTGYYRTLVKSYLQPALAEWTVYHALPFINFKLTNKAVSQKTSDNSNPSSIDDLKWLRSQVRNNAEFYSQRMKDYINNYPAEFPEFFTSVNNFDIKPNKSNYFSGIKTSGSRYTGPPPSWGNIDPNEFNC